MPYSTTPITSGAAKFSTLDPDADLFLEENNITVGANPESPATLYDYDTSTLNINNIVGNNGEVNLNNSDLIGVKQFICADYLGAIKGEASDNVEWTLTLNYVTTNYTKKFRVPSNFISGSTVNLLINVVNVYTSASQNVLLFKYSQETETYTQIDTISIPANTTNPTEVKFSNISINPAEYLCFKGSSTKVGVYGDMGVKICCNLSSVTGGYWEISN